MKIHYKMQELIAGLTFFTRLPLPVRFMPAQPMPLAALVWTFPLAGLLVGLLSGTVYGLLHATGLSIALTTVLTVLFQILLTGALHEDGLADTADGLFGGKDKSQRLAIMRDSRIGSFGALALILSVALRTEALRSIVTPATVLTAMMAAGILSRGMIGLLMATLPGARDDGLAAWAGRPARTSLFTCLGLTLLLTLFLANITGLLLLIAALLTTALIGWVAYRTIGGVTGDIYGAMQQCIEIVTLILCTLLLPR